MSGNTVERVRMKRFIRHRVHASEYVVHVSFEFCKHVEASIGYIVSHLKYFES